jgi:hypothetical protein
MGFIVGVVVSCPALMRRPAYVAFWQVEDRSNIVTRIIDCLGPVFVQGCTPDYGLPGWTMVATGEKTEISNLTFVKRPGRTACPSLMRDL